MSHIRVELQDEFGVQIGTESSFPSNLVPALDDKRFCCLRFIDPYGDTVFNRAQMEAFLEELRQVMPNAANSEDTKALLDIQKLADECLIHPHLYLKFIGD